MDIRVSRVVAVRIAVTVEITRVGRATTSNRRKPEVNAPLITLNLLLLDNMTVLNCFV